MDTEKESQQPTREPPEATPEILVKSLDKPKPAPATQDILELTEKALKNEAKQERI